MWVTVPLEVTVSWRIASQPALPLAGAEHTRSLRCPVLAADGAADAEAAGTSAAKAKVRTAG